MKSLIAGALIGSLLVLVSCKNAHEEAEFKVVEVEKPVLEKEVVAVAAVEESRDPNAGPDLERGKKIWTTTCNQCHNKDPNLKGAVGPETVDAPLEVMIHKVTTGRYPDVLPPGFVPKRKTKAMKAFPQLEKDVPSIHAYIQSVKKAK
jgi:mono/diheme cytochrome c family protein